VTVRAHRAVTSGRRAGGPEDLPVIDLGDPGDDLARGWDRAGFEDRYAQLAFGLGTVPRRVHRDEPLWQTPAGLLTVVAVLLLLLLASA
jgi:hypothetical protein